MNDAFEGREEGGRGRGPHPWRRDVGVCACWHGLVVCRRAGKDTHAL